MDAPQCGDNLWQQGPEFATTNEEDWSKVGPSPSPREEETIQEVKAFVSIDDNPKKPALELNISWSKNVRAVAYVLRCQAALGQRKHDGI